MIEYSGTELQEHGIHPIRLSGAGFYYMLEKPHERRFPDEYPSSPDRLRLPDRRTPPHHLSPGARLPATAGPADEGFVLGGVRHGASFFPKSNYPEIKPLKEGVLDFKHYHTYDEVNFFLKKWAADYPNLVDLYSVGKSYEGREIWQMTITNKTTGKDIDKPAMFIEGNRHSGEVTAAESALWFAWHILSSYGKDPELTAMVDNTALYVKVKNNPDGSSYRDRSEADRQHDRVTMTLPRSSTRLSSTSMAMDHFQVQEGSEGR